MFYTAYKRYPIDSKYGGSIKICAASVISRIKI